MSPLPVRMRAEDQTGRPADLEMVRNVRSRPLHKQTGQLEVAREHLTTATTMFRAMGMKFWLERSEAALP